MLSIVTPTSGRPEAFALLEQWVAAQDYAHPFEWIVASDDTAGYTFHHRQVVIHTTPVRDQHSLCTNLRAGLAACHGDKIVILEDDDYYAPHYLTTMADWLDEFPLVGSAPAIYYHVGTNRYRRMQSQTHASLAQTGITLAVYHDLMSHARGRSPFVDLALWRGWSGPRKLLPSGGLHVSIKGMPGKPGIGIGHRADMGAYDEDLDIFRRLKLPEVYLRYANPQTIGENALRTAWHRSAPLVAPSGSKGTAKAYQGVCERKPWEYTVTAVIPHLNTPAPLLWAIRTLQEQSVTPYILVMDTGSHPDVIEEIEGYRSETVEIHYLRSHGWTHSSAPVAVALDTAHALCRTEFLYHTHSDCFVRRRDWLEWLLGECTPDQPVVGYQMSDRSWATDQWSWMVSHTATMLHWPTLRTAGVNWSMDRYREHSGVNGLGWPDTETGFNWSLRLAGITPKLLGPEFNYTRQTDENIDHVRSYGSYAIYGSTSNQDRADKDRWIRLAIDDARRNVERWCLAGPAQSGNPAPQGG